MNTLESKLFSWKDWEKDGQFATYFYDCHLKAPIGGHKVGEKINVIYIDLELATISLGPVGSELEIYELSYSVGNKVATY